MNVDWPGLGAALVQRGEVAPATCRPRRAPRAAAGAPSMRSGICADRAQVVGDVLADLPVAARGAAHEHPVAIEQADREAVDLRLDDVLEARLGDPLAGEMRRASARPTRAAPPLSGRSRARASARGGVTFSRRPTGSPPTLRVGESRRCQVGMLGLDRRAAHRAARSYCVDRRSPGRRARSSGGRDARARRAARARCGRRARRSGRGASPRSRRCGVRPGVRSFSRSKRRSASRLGRSVRSKWIGVTAIRPCATAARSVPGSSWNPGSEPYIQ